MTKTAIRSNVRYLRQLVRELEAAALSGADQAECEDIASEIYGTVDLLVGCDSES